MGLTKIRPGAIYPHCRHMSIIIVGGSIFMFITDLFPFMFSFNLSFEYGCLFYPALASFVFSMYAAVVYWRQELLPEDIPTVVAIGWVAVFLMIVQFIFCIVADSLYHFEVIVTGSGYMNAATLFFVVFRFWSIPQAFLIFLLCKWSNTMYKNPGAEQEFLYAIKNRGKKMNEDTASTAQSDTYHGKAQEATV